MPGVVIWEVCLPALARVSLPPHHLHHHLRLHRLHQHLDISAAKGNGWRLKGVETYVDLFKDRVDEIGVLDDDIALKLLQENRDGLLEDLCLMSILLTSQHHLRDHIHHVSRNFLRIFILHQFRDYRERRLDILHKGASHSVSNFGDGS